MQTAAHLESPQNQLNVVGLIWKVAQKPSNPVRIPQHGGL